MSDEPTGYRRMKGWPKEGTPKLAARQRELYSLQRLYEAVLRGKKAPLRAQWQSGPSRHDRIGSLKSSGGSE